MAGEFVVPKLDAIVSRARQSVRAFLRGAASLDPYSDYDVLTKVLGTLTQPLYGRIALAALQFFPTEALPENLPRHGELRGITRKDAVEAEGLVLLRALAGSVQPNNSLLTSPTGLTYHTSSARTSAVGLWSNKLVVSYDELRPDTVVVSSTAGMSVGDVFGINGNFYAIKDLPGGGAVVIYGRFKVSPSAALPADELYPEPGVVIPIKADAVGSAYNSVYGTELTFQTVVTNPTVEVLELAGGDEIESQRAWAQRMADADAEKRAANNRSEALQLLLAQPGVDQAWVYDVYNGPGTMRAIVQGVKGARHLGAARVASIQSVIAPQPPTDANPGFVAVGGHDWQITDFPDQFVDVDLILTGGIGFGPDWTGTLTTAVGCTTSRINTAIDPRPFIAARSRVVIPTAPPLFLEQAEVAAVDATGFSIVGEISTAVPAGRVIRPGSNLIVPVRDNILDMFGALGPGDTSPPSRYPSTTTRGPSDITHNLLHAVVRAVSGVKNLTINLPVTDVVPPPLTQCMLRALTLRYA